MNVAQTPWLAAYGTIVFSLLVGLVCAYRMPKPSRPLRSAGRDTVRDLETRYDQYIDQLRDVGQQAHRLSEAGLAKERGQYEALAQDVLRKLHKARRLITEEHAAPAPPAAHAAGAPGQPGLPFWTRHPQLKGALWGVGATSLALFLYTTVQQDGRVAPARPMSQGASAPQGQSAQGPMLPPGATPQAGQKVDMAEMKRLAEAIKADPDDADKLLKFAHMLLRAQLLEEARTINDRALRLRPNDLEALTHAAVLSASAGDTGSSDIGLDMVLKKDPTFVEAWFFRGMLAMQRGDTARVEASFAAFLQHAPAGEQRDRVQGMLTRMQGGR